MPQLTFDRDLCPKTISVGLKWNQLEDTWELWCFMYNQQDALQESYSKRLPDSFSTIELCMTVERLFEDWIDTTPGYAIGHFAKSVKAIVPPEVPAGLDPRRGPSGVATSGRRGEDTAKRAWPPTQR